eukprot:jgi/Botrbrau1/4134/Bobra.0192s0008.2
MRLLVQKLNTAKGAAESDFGELGHGLSTIEQDGKDTGSDRDIPALVKTLDWKEFTEIEEDANCLKAQSPRGWDAKQSLFKSNFNASTQYVLALPERPEKRPRLAKRSPTDKHGRGHAQQERSGKQYFLPDQPVVGLQHNKGPTKTLSKGSAEAALQRSSHRSWSGFADAPVKPIDSFKEQQGRVPEQKAPASLQDLQKFPTVFPSLQRQHQTHYAHEGLQKGTDATGVAASTAARQDVSTLWPLPFNSMRLRQQLPSTARQNEDRPGSSCIPKLEAPPSFEGGNPAQPPVSALAGANALAYSPRQPLAKASCNEATSAHVSNLKPTPSSGSQQHWGQHPGDERPLRPRHQAKLHNAGLAGGLRPAQASRWSQYGLDVGEPLSKEAAQGHTENDAVFRLKGLDNSTWGSLEHGRKAIHNPVSAWAKGAASNSTDPRWVGDADVVTSLD